MSAADISITVPPDPVQAASAAASIRTADRAERPRVADVLADGFYDDPFLSWMFPDDSRRREQLRKLFAYMGDRIWFDHGLTYTTDGVVGAAVWIPPDKWRVSILEQLRLMPGFVASVGLRDLPRALRAFNTMESKHPHDEHYYLPVVAVAPAWQGKGLGTALLQPILRRCDEEGVPAYLEATSPRNRACYERNGFRVIGELPFPKGPTLWLMRRVPGGA